MSVTRVLQTLPRTQVTGAIVDLLAVGWDHFDGLGKPQMFSRLRFLCMNARMHWTEYPPSYQLITNVEDFASSCAYRTVGLRTSCILGWSKRFLPIMRFSLVCALSINKTAREEHISFIFLKTIKSIRFVRFEVYS